MGGLHLLVSLAAARAGVAYISPMLVWLSYCFYSQLRKPFSEVLFVPISQESRPQGFIGTRPGDEVG